MATLRNHVAKIPERQIIKEILDPHYARLEINLDKTGQPAG
jgi:hypothetical protein